MAVQPQAVSKAYTPGNNQHTGQEPHDSTQLGLPSPRDGASILSSTLEASDVTIGEGDGLLV